MQTKEFGNLLMPRKARKTIGSWSSTMRRRGFLELLQQSKRTNVVTPLPRTGFRRLAFRKICVSSSLKRHPQHDRAICRFLSLHPHTLSERGRAVVVAFAAHLHYVRRHP